MSFAADELFGFDSQEASEFKFVSFTSEDVLKQFDMLIDYDDIVEQLSF